MCTWNMYLKKYFKKYLMLMSKYHSISKEKGKVWKGQNYDPLFWYILMIYICY